METLQRTSTEESINVRKTPTVKKVVEKQNQENEIRNEFVWDIKNKSFQSQEQCEKTERCKKAKFDIQLELSELGRIIENKSKENAISELNDKNYYYKDRQIDEKAIEELKDDIEDVGVNIEKGKGEVKSKNRNNEKLSLEIETVNDTGKGKVLSKIKIGKNSLTLTLEDSFSKNTSASIYFGRDNHKRVAFLGNDTLEVFNTDTLSSEEFITPAGFFWSVEISRDSSLIYENSEDANDHDEVYVRDAENNYNKIFETTGESIRGQRIDQAANSSFLIYDNSQNVYVYSNKSGSWQNEVEYEQGASSFDSTITDDENWLAHPDDSNTTVQIHFRDANNGFAIDTSKTLDSSNDEVKQILSDQSSTYVYVLVRDTSTNEERVEVYDINNSFTNTSTISLTGDGYDMFRYDARNQLILRDESPQEIKVYDQDTHSLEYQFSDSFDDVVLGKNGNKALTGDFEEIQFRDPDDLSKIYNSETLESNNVLSLNTEPYIYRDEVTNDTKIDLYNDDTQEYSGVVELPDGTTESGVTVTFIEQSSNSIVSVETFSDGTYKAFLNQNNEYDAYAKYDDGSNKFNAFSKPYL